MTQITKIVKPENFAVSANAWYLQRVQDISYSLENEYSVLQELNSIYPVESLPISSKINFDIKTLEHGSMRNLRCILGLTGYDVITITSLEHAACPIMMQNKNRNETTVARSFLFPNAYLDNISWSFDANGLAEENFSFSAESFEVYMNNKADLLPVKGYYSSFEILNHSGYFIVPISAAGQVTLQSVYLDAIKITGSKISQINSVPSFWSLNGVKVLVIDSGLSTMGNNQVAIFSTNSNSYAVKRTTNTIGGLTRGKVNLFMTSGTGNLDSSILNRCQSCQISVDLSRDSIYEMCNETYADKFLIDYTIDLSLDLHHTDLEHMNCFISGNVNSLDELSIGNFINDAKFRIDMYNKIDLDPTRSLVKSILLTGLELMSYDGSVAVGSSVNNISLKMRAKYISINGLGLIGTGSSFYPAFTSTINE